MVEGRKNKAHRIARVFIFDDQELIRHLAKDILEANGYEVYTFSYPFNCELCQCADGNACADVIISDVNMPNTTGLEFIENQINTGCKIENIALMSGSWSESGLEKAKRLGCKVFHKPFDIKEMTKWLENCEKNTDSSRILASYYLNKNK